MVEKQNKFVYPLAGKAAFIWNNRYKGNKQLAFKPPPSYCQVLHLLLILK